MSAQVESKKQALDGLSAEEVERVRRDGII
jgi:hypothetical protein